jgi:hypothetical protein
MPEDGPQTGHPEDVPEEEADDEETAALRPLFPEGEESPTSAEQWQDLFGGEE